VTETEIAFRAAINVLRDSAESRRLPCGERLEPDASRPMPERPITWSTCCFATPAENRCYD